MDSIEQDTVSHTPTVGGARAESSARSVEDVAGLSALFEAT